VLVVQIGAALGRQFSHELISAVAELPQQQLDDVLTQLLNAELIFRRGMPPNAEYTFKHALVQDAAYSTLLRSLRQQLHARIASILESQFPDVVETQPELLGQHFGEGGFEEKAITYRKGRSSAMPMQRRSSIFAGHWSCCKDNPKQSSAANLS
jgi:predicted ATPase